MSMRTISCLSYGYDIGGGDSDWRLHGLDQNGKLSVDWWHGLVHGFSESATRKLLATNGFTEKREDDIDGYCFREIAAMAQLGVKVLTCGSSDYPSGYVICHRDFIRTSWYSRECDPIVPEGANEALEAAIEALGLRPTQESPRWILSSYYG